MLSMTMKSDCMNNVFHILEVPEVPKNSVLNHFRRSVKAIPGITVDPGIAGCHVALGFCFPRMTGSHVILGSVIRPILSTVFLRRITRRISSQDHLSVVWIRRLILPDHHLLRLLNRQDCVLCTIRVCTYHILSRIKILVDDTNFIL